MGFDLHGVAPKNKTGEYFRNNGWYWRPLWFYVCDVCSIIITSKQKEGGQSNSGTLITERQAVLIAQGLEEELTSERTKAHELLYKQEQEEMPDEECELCHGEGKRNDAWVKGECNACRGKGKRRPWICSYPFSVSNVRGFVEFCRQSGGFTID